MSITAERAVEILDPEHREHYESIELVNEACRMGREAILKQIPMELDYEADGYGDDGNLVYDRAYCRSCHHEFEYDYEWGLKHCPDCGQALAWIEEE